MPPNTLEASNWLNVVNGVVHATKLPTCDSSTDDYFVVHKSISHAVVQVQRFEDAGLYPHFPSGLLLRGNANRYLVRKLNQARRVGAELPAGPPSKPRSFADVGHAILTDVNGYHFVV